MTRDQMAAFDEMPFHLFAKDPEGRYLFASAAIGEAAGRDPTGLTDADMPWAADAGVFREHERRVLQTGETLYAHEHGTLPDGSTLVLSICKWRGELDGQPCVFGIGFPIPEDQPT